MIVRKEDAGMTFSIERLLGKEGAGINKRGGAKLWGIEKRKS